MENIESNFYKNETEAAEQIDLADMAVRESIERIRKNLEEKQKESKDEFFKKLKIGELTPEALMVLNASIEEEKSFFPKGSKKEAVKVMIESGLYPQHFNNPEDRLNYIKELITLYPNNFYKREEKFEK